MTDFDPKTDGFAFANTFENDFINELDVRTGGLCGGMVYTALDYYLYHMPITTQDYRPAVQTRLHDYIYDRQVTSQAQNLDKWAELMANPFGARNGEFFNWGLQGYNGGRLQELRAKIDRGSPVPLGLWHYGSLPGGDHQVLAIGYDVGRYQGHFGAHKEDLKIYVYDPNHPGTTMTLVPDLHLGGFRYTNSDETWLTYFVDGKYRKHRPPRSTTERASVVVHTPGSRDDDHDNAKKLPPATTAVLARALARNPVVLKMPLAIKPTTRELLLTIRTGADDLRGGGDNVNVRIRFRGHPPLYKENLNNNRHWIGNYAQTMSIRLPQAVALEDMVDLTLTTNFGGGLFGDNWNVDRVLVEAVTADHKKHALADESGEPLVRFTGETHQYRVDLSR